MNSDLRYGYINKANKLVISAKYEIATHFYKGYALVKENYNSPAVLIDSTGSTIATFPKDVSFINNEKPGAGIFGGEQGEYPFYISETLKQLVDEGKGIFERGLSYGLIDSKGNIILDLTYIYLSDYHDDYKDCQTGILSRQGRVEEYQGYLRKCKINCGSKV